MSLLRLCCTQVCADSHAGDTGCYGKAYGALLSFTADEIWQYISSLINSQVCTQPVYTGEREYRDKSLNERWKR
jgi:isoleucyl-tRNA synthetase